MNPVLIVASILILISLYRYSTNPNVPQSPAACSIAFFIATAGVAAWQYLLTALPSGFLHLVISLISLPLISMSAGYVAARTKEDTASMNVKIVAGAAFIPYLIVTFISSISLPSWMVIYAGIIFIPCMLLGKKINTTYDKSMYQTAKASLYLDAKKLND